MNLISKVAIKNFKCFRERIEIPLDRGAYLIGVNNAGKTAVLNAINFFFDNSVFSDESFLNITEYLAKKAGYNRSEITLFFNLNSVTSKALRNRLIKIFSSDTAAIKKNIIFTPDAGRFSFNYIIKGDSFNYDELDDSIKKLLKSVNLIYIHPQEGRELLVNAQNKLRKRLLANWGRGARLSHSIRDLQEKWGELRKQAREYLSKSLSENLQDMWPGSRASIDLPRDVRDIVAISDITFKGDPSLPDVDLTAQGTGAQTTILYLTHYLLDSDRSLHQGEYHPVWLLEEPESFLHADLIAKFGIQLNSQGWLNNIQMVVSTHSPVLLATSRLSKESIVWNVFDNHGLKKSKKVDEWDDKEIDEIGKLMGDQNFQVYFASTKYAKTRDEKLIFIEDKRPLTKQKFEEAGIEVEKALGGMTMIKRYIEVLLGSPKFYSNSIYFIIDGDSGFSEMGNLIDSALTQEMNGFKKYKVLESDNIFIVVLPKGKSAEDLFGEYDTHLLDCINKMWNIKSWGMRRAIPRELVSVAADCRRKKIDSIDIAISAIKNLQDIKDIFWNRVDRDNLCFSRSKIAALKHLL